MTAGTLKVLLVAAEVAPFAKVGGLADVAGALPKALQALGHDVRVAMPLYRLVETDSKVARENLLSAFPVPTRSGVREQAFVQCTRLPVGKEATAPTDVRSRREATRDEAALPVYLIGQAPSLAPALSKGTARSIYFQQAVDSQTIYTPEPEPYIFFCRAVLEMLRRLQTNWQPDVIHCNDWHTGLIPVFARRDYHDVPAIRNAAILFTIHNLAYQGCFARDHWAATGLSDSLYTPEGLEFYGEWSFMKGALMYADRTNTVSENYAREIQTPQYGCGLDGLMRTLSAQNRLSGILNGIDYGEYNPAADPRIPYHFDADDLTGKAQAKAALQAELGLPQDARAVIGMVSRLAEQKGLDLVEEIAEQMLGLPLQFVLLGTGDLHFQKRFQRLQARYPQQVHARFGFDVELAQRIYAGSDLFLMPSRFEPCGLGQMMALRYGTLPIVRATGGLADTIHDIDPATHSEGNGFVFHAYTGAALLATIRRAVATVADAALRKRVVQRALRSDFSWNRSATRYAALYTETARAHRSDQPPA